MAFFKKRCGYCGAELADSNFTERMGRKFCSLDHAERYMSYQTKSDSRGGCC